MFKQTISIFGIFVLSLSFIAAAGSFQEWTLIGSGPANGSVNAIYIKGSFPPLVFLSSLQDGRVLGNSNSGLNGNISNRTNNYAFTGESITYEVLVWDKNGVPEKINDVYAGWANRTNGPVDPAMQANCEYNSIQPADGTNLSSLGYSNVRRPNDQEPQLTFNGNTMGIYKCILTIEPNCDGNIWLGVKAVDLDGNTSTASGQEAWYCNPSLDINVSGTINFGELGPGEQGSSTVSITSNAPGGTQVVLSIAGSDFYDPTPSGAKCPTTNALQLQGDGNAFTTGFWYKATMGSLTTGNKRIPYGCTTTSCSIASSDPIFSKSNSTNNWKDWTGTLYPMSSGSSVSLTMNLGIPQPCNGGPFTEGKINLFAYAL